MRLAWKWNLTLTIPAMVRWEKINKLVLFRINAQLEEMLIFSLTETAVAVPFSTPSKLGLRSYSSLETLK